MTVLIAGAPGILEQAIAHELGNDYRLRVLHAGGPNGAVLSRGSLSDGVAGADAVVHTGVPESYAPEEEPAILDWCTRDTYALVAAAIEAGSRRFVYCGSLVELFDRYPEERYISELHQPLPPAGGRALASYLGELVVREFAREHPITATCLRLGALEHEDNASRPPDESWLDPRDAARAVRLALGRDRGDELSWGQRWALYHICSLPPNPRFLLDKARALGFEPQHNFAAAWPRGQVQ